jgi:DNA-binding beta-propeller fold protein YncE
MDGYSCGQNRGGSIVSAVSMSWPFSVVLDTGNNLYVADRSNNRVLLFPVNTTLPVRVYGQTSFAGGSLNAGGTPTAATLNEPFGVALDTSGRLYVADHANNRVLMFPKRTFPTG